MKYNKNNSEVVYSTEYGRMCPTCKKAFSRCICKQIEKQKIPKNDGIVRVSREVKGRKGKGVTLIKGVSLAQDELKQLTKKLKQNCGCGGTFKNGIIEIQGDKRDLLVEELKKHGFKVKRSGG